MFSEPKKRPREEELKRGTGKRGLRALADTPRLKWPPRQRTAEEAVQATWRELQILATELGTDRCGGSA